MVASGSRTMIAGSFIQLYRWFPSILQVLTVIQPETLVRWHKAGFPCYWRRNSRPLGGRPQIDAELRDAAFSICQYNVRADDDCQEVYA